MSCRFCVHWTPYSTWSDQYEEDGLGNCTLNPIWIKTKKSHHCGQLTLDTSRGETMEYWRSSFSKAYAMAGEERKKRIDLEKKVKSLRADIRELKNEKKP